MSEHIAGSVLFTINMRTLAPFYERVAGMRVLRREDDHVVLENGSFQLIVHQIPERHAKGIVITSPPAVRESSALKLSLRVRSIADSREVAAQLGGAVFPPDREWHYDGNTVCDGYDPDGNVFQLFE